MATNGQISKIISADAANTVRENYTYDDGSAVNDTFKNFDNLSGQTFMHDQINLTGVFDAAGGIFTDGVNDLQDRINAIKLNYGDFDGDGKSDDVTLQINGISNFKLTFIDPASPYRGGFDIGSGAGVYDDIAVYSPAPEEQTQTPVPTDSADILYTDKISGPTVGGLGDDIIYADSAKTRADVIKYLSGAGEGHDTIYNFDNISGDGSSHDQIDLGRVFDKLAGKYSDGTNDYADRLAALHFQTGDFNGDGKADDTRISIDGVSDFDITLIKPVYAGKEGFDIAASGTSADILIGKGVTATPSTPSTPTEPTTPTPPATPTPTPTPPSGGTNNSGDHVSWTRLDNGLNIEFSEVSKISVNELKALAADGVENIRIQLQPAQYLTPGKAMDPANNGTIKLMTQFMDKVVQAGLAVVVTPFGANEWSPWQADPNNQAAINMYSGWMKEFAGYIAGHYNPQDVFIEMKAEPFMTDLSAWTRIQSQFLDAARSAAPDFTLVAAANGRIGQNNWSMIDSLIQTTPYGDKNVVYNIHFYEPIYFTGQGVPWDPAQKNNTGNHYPGYDGFNADVIDQKFGQLAAWADKYGVKITVNEFGTYNQIPANERALYLHDIRAAADKYDFGWDVWEYNKGYSVAKTDAAGNRYIPDDLLKALQWGDNQDADTWYNTHGAGSTSASSASTNASQSSVAATTGGTTTTGDAKTTTVTPPPVTSTTAAVQRADAAMTVNEKFVFTAQDLHRTVTIENYDNLSGATLVHDQIDLTKVFEAAGGLYADGINDFADRKAGLVFKTGDFNGDGHANDTLITINGVNDFALKLIAPAADYSTAFDIGNGHGTYDDIIIA